MNFLIFLGEVSNELKIREEGQLKVGTFGQPVDIVSNFFKVDFKSADLHLYNVVFDPDIQSSRFKSAMLHKVDDVIGTTRCFDGMVMFLPKKLPELVTKKCVKSQKGEDITITITHRCAVPANSPSVVQLMNILFKKYVNNIFLVLLFVEIFCFFFKLLIKFLNFTDS